MSMIKNVLAASAMLAGLTLTATPAFAEGAVKVECGPLCSNTNLGQVCDTFRVGSLPVAIACDDTATPGSGGARACGGATCTPFGSIVRSDSIAAYCFPGFQNDVIVTCR